MTSSANLYRPILIAARQPDTMEYMYYEDHTREIIRKICEYGMDDWVPECCLFGIIDQRLPFEKQIKVLVRALLIMSERGCIEFGFPSKNGFAASDLQGHRAVRHFESKWRGSPHRVPRLGDDWFWLNVTVDNRDMAQLCCGRV